MGLKIQSNIAAMASIPLRSSGSNSVASTVMAAQVSKVQPTGDVVTLSSTDAGKTMAIHTPEKSPMPTPSNASGAGDKVSNIVIGSGSPPSSASSEASSKLLENRAGGSNRFEKTIGNLNVSGMGGDPNMGSGSDALAAFRTEQISNQKGPTPPTFDDGRGEKPKDTIRERSFAIEMVRYR